MQILIVAHTSLAPYGLVGRMLLEQGASITVVRPSEGVPLPEKSDAYDGLVILGGLQNAMQDKEFPHFIPLMALIHDFERVEKPVLGICLGAQLLARSHGARVHRMPQAERGFTLVKKTLAAKSDPLFSLTPETPYLMEWHEDAFDLPSGARLLATGDNCANQAFCIRRASYGVQFSTPRPLPRSFGAGLIPDPKTSNAKIPTLQTALKPKRRNICRGHSHIAEVSLWRGSPSSGSNIDRSFFYHENRSRSATPLFQQNPVDFTKIFPHILSYDGPPHAHGWRWIRKCPRRRRKLWQLFL